MSAALLLGNLALLAEAGSRRTAKADRAPKAWRLEAAACRAARRDAPLGPLLSTSIHAKSFHNPPDMVREAARLALRRRGGKNSKVAASSSGGGGGSDGGDEEYDWEEELRSRLKDFEEMIELEKKAEELQRSEAGDGTGEEETEEEKRERVRRELERVSLLD